MADGPKPLKLVTVSSIRRIGRCVQGRFHLFLKARDYVGMLDAFLLPKLGKSIDQPTLKICVALNAQVANIVFSEHGFWWCKLGIIDRRRAYRSIAANPTGVSLNLYATMLCVELVWMSTRAWRRLSRKQCSVFGTRRRPLDVRNGARGCLAVSDPILAIAPIAANSQRRHVAPQKPLAHRH